MGRGTDEIKLSILIPTLESRQTQFDSLTEKLNALAIDLPVEFCTMCDNGNLTIGAKRNRLLAMAAGEYVAFVDDDDQVSDDYFEQLFDGIGKGVDCCSLVGEITVNGNNPKKFIHSIQYNEYFENGSIYYRPPNHLNCIKRDIAKRFKFPETDFGEDTDWAMQICNAGVLKYEHHIKDTIYYYKYKTKK